MTELTQEELNNGKKVLGGITIFFWVLAVIIGIGLFSLNFGDWAREFYIGPVAIGLPAPNTSWIFLALYVVGLVGLYMRKSWAVPLGRAALVVAMVIFFPVGTIFGAILWKRFNDPVAKRYLNYPVIQEKEESEEPKK
ncbi:MAG: hypothetical protein FJW61_00875 [Actinobacteria bacterium]|nr:hypothetical protein [Actinomycetota bacterium]